MEFPESSDLTRLLQGIEAGDRDAKSLLFTAIYQALKRITSRHMRKEPPGNILQTTPLANESYLKLIRQREASWQNRAHFFGVTPGGYAGSRTDVIRAETRRRGSASASGRRASFLR